MYKLDKKFVYTQNKRNAISFGPDYKNNDVPEPTGTQLYFKEYSIVKHNNATPKYFCFFGSMFTIFYAKHTLKTQTFRSFFSLASFSSFCKFAISGKFMIL